MWKMCAMGFKWACRSMGKKRKNSFHFVNKLWYSNNAGCAISQKKNMRTYRQAYGWTTHTHTHSHTQTHTCCEGSMKKVPGDKINLCIRNELRDTQDASAQQQQQQLQWNNNNNDHTMGTGCHFAENGQLRQALQLGEPFFIRTYCSTVPCREEGRESEAQGQGRGGGACLFAFF